MPDPLDIFAANLRHLRPEHDLSQERLAHTADLNVTHAKIERREREPGVRTVSKLANALEVFAAELFDGIDGRPASSGCSQLHSPLMGTAQVRSPSGTVWLPV
jgi:transcriptional regulator with XRE-family HTH domain